MFELDEAWTCEFIIPLFSDANRDRFCQAWDGFLVWGQLNQSLADVLLPAFITSASRLDSYFHNNRERFIEYYTALAVQYIDDPRKRLIPELLNNCSTSDRIIFTQNLGFYIRNMSSDATKSLWDRWLHRYWQDRLKGIPVKLDEKEIIGMLEWLVHLGVCTLRVSN